jgi:hypothetical protein
MSYGRVEKDSGRAGGAVDRIMGLRATLRLGAGQTVIRQANLKSF